MKKHIICLLIVIAVGVASFFGGSYYQKKQGPAGFSNGKNFPGGTMGGPNGMANGSKANGSASRPTNGEITKIDGDSYTVKTNDGSTKVVIINSSTAVNEMSQTSKDKLQIGTKVMVSGTENSDKSVTAKTIEISPIKSQ